MAMQKATIVDIIRIPSISKNDRAKGHFAKSVLDYS